MIRNNNNRRRRGGNNGPRPQQMNGGGGNYGNRLDNRQRGNASQLLEKYKAMARDAQQAGDRVATEYYLQFAEHYYRMLGDYRDRQPEQNRPQRGQNFFDDDGGDGQFDGDDDGGNDDGQEQEEGWNTRRQQNDRPQNDRQQGDRQQNDRQQGERQQGDRQQADRQQNDRQQADRDQPRRDTRPAQNGRGNGYQQAPYQGEERRPYRDNAPRNQDSADAPRADWDDNRAPNRRDAAPRAEEVVRAAEPARPRREWQPRPPRDAAPQNDPYDAAADNGVIPGLPGPATLSMGSSEPAVEVSEVAAEPAPRRRGRPRKVVAEAPAEG